MKTRRKSSAKAVLGLLLVILAVAAPTDVYAIPTATAPSSQRVTGQWLLHPDASFDRDTVFETADGKQTVTELTWENGRHAGSALRFDGNTCLRIPFSAQEAPFTLSLWVNWQADRTEDAAAEQHIMTFLQAGTENVLYFSPLSRRSADRLNGMLLSGRWDRDGSPKFFEQFYPTDALRDNALPPAGWHHLALAVDTADITLYIDGMRWCQITTPFTYADLQTDTLLLGAAENGGGFTGLMQDVYCYDGLLTFAEIARLAQDADPFDETIAGIPLVYMPSLPGQTSVTDKVYTACSRDGKTTVVPETASAFWEQPLLEAGQTLSGTCIFENKSKGLVDMALTAITLPSPGSSAWDYLATLQLTVADEDTLLYHGAYTDITAAALTADFAGMSYGQRRKLTITLSRPEDAVEAPVEATVGWEISCTPAPRYSPQPGLPDNLWIFWLLLAASVLMSLSVYWAVIPRARRGFAVFDTAIAACRRRTARRNIREKR